ncbi:MAG TPA: hypothetical protein VER79_09145 [Candidatus Limnocylindrales bacterium]|nr:hypothetical protein [Candidatus Limnocylindrales bacterium]
MSQLVTVLAPLAQSDTSAAPPEQVALLFQLATFASVNGGWMTTALIATLAAGGIFCALTIIDWTRQRWGLVFPVLMLITAVILTVLGFILYSTFAGFQEVNFDWRGLAVDPAERALLDLSMGAISSVGAWILAGLSGALLFATLGVTALVRAARSKRRPPEHPEWQD